jgi:hypothetical protein
MSVKNPHPEYPTEAQMDEMWAAYKENGREGILAILRKRALELQQAEQNADTSSSRVEEA